MLRRVLISGYLFTISAWLWARHIPYLRQPILSENAWREADTFSVAKNFVLHGHNLFYPRIDWNDGYSGIMGMEFPFPAWIASWPMRIFGVHPGVMRTVVWCSFVSGLLAFLHATIRQRLLRHPSSYIVVATLSIAALHESRLILPDPVAVGCLGWATFFAQRVATRHESVWPLVAAATLALLIKSPCIIALPGLAMVAWGQSIRRQPSRCFAFFWLALPIFAWRLWDAWADHLTTEYHAGIPYFATEFDLQEILANLRNPGAHSFLLSSVLGTYILPWPLVPIAIIGLLSASWTRLVPYLAWIACGYFFLWAFSGRVQSHWYYAMPLLLPSLLLVARGLECLLFDTAVDTFKLFVLLFASMATFLLVDSLEGIPGVMLPGALLPHLERTFYAQPMTALYMLAALAIAALATQFRKSTAMVVVALTCSLIFRVARETDRVVEYRGRAQASYWFDDDIVPLRHAVQDLPDRQIVVDSAQPWHLYLAGKPGFSMDVTSMEMRGCRYFIDRGIHFVVLFGSHSPAWSGPYETGKTWRISRILCDR